ncbi:peptidoglycan-binding protein [Marinobacter halodurans]|uniref:Peptidoglycan-binding protein n=1 Tax=Marinobacter halodurans TaxID=2528979 RepID=A0ABY1ZLJ0_9GAMM|nr:peptidoglycan-binding protein [Marinobacter halodurans]
MAVLMAVVLAPQCVASEQLRERIEALQAGYAAAAGGEPLIATRALGDFYEARGYTRAWIRPELQDAWMNVLEGIASDGLAPRDYHAEALARLLEDDGASLAPESQADLDLLLSDSFLLLASHLLDGKVNPETADPEWKADRHERELYKMLAQALDSGNLVATVDALRPSQGGYLALRSAHSRLAAMANMAWPPIPDGPSLRVGDSDERLSAIRQRLRLLGDLDAPEAGEPVADNYDALLESAMKSFQRRHGLEDDGIIGPATLAMVNLTPAQRLEMVDLNMERWRWLPDTLGPRYILVNIAAFELEVVQDGQVVLEKPVIVGQPYRRTPVFSDQIRYLVFNPTWTVPAKLIVQDKLPQILQDPGYLERLGFQVYQGWGTDRRRVAPAGVDWTRVSARNLPYQLVQAPGPQNALGQVKFMFPNKYDVYLHDTPSRELFAKKARTFSSGCIRLKDPLELAELLLKGKAGWDDARIRSVLASRATTTVLLDHPMPIHLQYWTAWVDGSGTLQFRSDVYGRDPAVLAALHKARTPGTAAQ